MQEWKLPEWRKQEQIARMDNTGVEKAGVDCTGGKCRSGKYGSENVWKTVRTENKIRIKNSMFSKNQLKLNSATYAQQAKYGGCSSDAHPSQWCCICTNWTYTKLKLNAFLSFFSLQT